MSQLTYRANLSASIFPLTVAKAGRSVVVPTSDQNYSRWVDAAGNAQDAIGIPQAIYMENVLPTANGYQSVGFTPKPSIPNIGVAGRAILFQISVPILSSSALSTTPSIELAFFNNAPHVLCAFSNLVENSWVPITGDDPGPVFEDQISFAVVGNLTYIMVNDFPTGDSKIYQVNCLVPESPALVFTDVSASVTGVALNEIHYIVGAFNYLIAVRRDDGHTHWSSTTTPLDFTTSLVSGAGAELVTAVTQYVTGLTENAAGFYIYTQNNVVAAVYTGNARYPWKFREIPGSLGCRDSRQFVRDTNSNFQLLLSGKGIIQTLDISGAQSVAPEVSEFLERSRTYDEFNPYSGSFSLTQITGLFQYELSTLVTRGARIGFFHNRYITISYGALDDTYQTMQYCIVYDYVLKRYGKLKIPHSYIFSSNTAVFLTNYLTGKIVELSFDLYSQDLDNVVSGNRYKHQGVLILGKFQYVRARNIIIEQFDIESVKDLSLLASPSEQNFSCYIMPSMDGKNFLPPIIPYLATQEGSLLTYNSHLECKNFALALFGAFDMSSLEMKFCLGGND